jgi:Uma2 family endonuclease
MASQANPLLTPEEYLDIERRAEFRSEYYQGQMFAMSGATGSHTVITVNLVREMSTELRRGPCQLYTHDMRVQVSKTGLYTYPDIVVACAGRKFLDEREDTLLNPIVIVEVLSESTEAYDRGKKFEQYRTLESLQEYVLVAQDRMLVESYRRQASGQWLLTTAAEADNILELSSVNCRLKLADVYENVTLPA